MKSIQFAPKWPRFARLSLALATLAAPVCTLAQSTNFPRYTIVDLGPVGPSWSQGQPFTVSGNGLVSGETVLANPNNPAEWVSHAVVWERTRTKTLGSRTRRAKQRCLWRELLGAGSRASRHANPGSEWRRLLRIHGARSHP